MLIYEVNIQVNKDIFQEYYQWLLEHINHILQIDGFNKADVGIVEQSEKDNTTQIRVSYFVDSQTHFQNYLTLHAPQLRAEGITKFKDQFTIQRRVILEAVELKAKVCS